MPVAVISIDGMCDCLYKLEARPLGIMLTKQVSGAGSELCA